MPCNCLCTAAISDVRRLAPWRPVCCEVPSVLLQSSQGAVNYDCNVTSSKPLSKTREQVAKLTLPDPSEPAGTALPAKANRKTPRNSAPSARPNLTHPCSSKSSTVSVDARTAHFFVTARGYEALLLHVILWHAGTSPSSNTCLHDHRDSEGDRLINQRGNPWLVGQHEDMPAGQAHVCSRKSCCACSLSTMSLEYLTTPPNLSKSSLAQATFTSG